QLIERRPNFLLLSFHPSLLLSRRVSRCCPRPSSLTSCLRRVAPRRHPTPIHITWHRRRYIRGHHPRYLRNRRRNIRKQLLRRLSTYHGQSHNFTFSLELLLPA